MGAHPSMVMTPPTMPKRLLMKSTIRSLRSSMYSITCSQHQRQVTYIHVHRMKSPHIDHVA